jgi:hypothetical protein
VRPLAILSTSRFRKRLNGRGHGRDHPRSRRPTSSAASPTVCCRVEQGVLWGEYVVQGEFLRGHVARQDDLSGAHWGVTAQDAGPAQPIKLLLRISNGTSCVHAYLLPKRRDRQQAHIKPSLSRATAFVTNHAPMVGDAY